ncbi:MAG: ATP-dependent Clp protease adaptor ClpS [Deltaproteobacteria bacterium]|nr:ATP-dependent Clp protease adaptor ClpS [Deltaproteobacteria bacterium]
MADPKNPDGPKEPGKPGKDGGAGTQTLERVRTKKPQLWRVLMHNDDFTTQEFVVHVLVQFFRKDPTEANALMLKVHMSGRAIVGVYTKDVAETKRDQVTDYAREHGHPLMITLEPDA